MMHLYYTCITAAIVNTTTDNRGLQELPRLAP